jgi:hypothetical protein
MGFYKYFWLVTVTIQLIRATSYTIKIRPYKSYPQILEALSMSWVTRKANKLCIVYMPLLITDSQLDTALYPDMLI